MGDIRRYKCRCGYEKKIMVGAGLGSQNLDIIRNCVPEDVFSDFMREKCADNVSEFGSVVLPVCCTERAELEKANVFSYSLSDGEFRYVSPCPRCGEVHEPIEDPDLLFCPKCGSEMTYSVEGLWD